MILKQFKRNNLYTYNIKCLNVPLFLFTQNEDGRVNSCLDEDLIITLLCDEYKKRIQKPKKRMWYDILVFDHYYHWIPINIKTTTTFTCDNTGNLAMCVYAYSNENIDLSKTYNSGTMKKLLIKNLQEKDFNQKSKKDYYFIVINKNNSSDIIINSLKGLVYLTPNVNNLPFQIC